VGLGESGRDRVRKRAAWGASVFPAKGGVKLIDKRRSLDPETPGGRGVACPTCSI
jgi:hypothetical protein